MNLPRRKCFQLVAATNRKAEVWKNRERFFNRVQRLEWHARNFIRPDEGWQYRGPAFIKIH